MNEYDNGGYEQDFKYGRKLSHFLVDVTAHGRENLSHALALAFAGVASVPGMASHYRIDGGQHLTFFSAWRDPDISADKIPFTEPKGHQEATDFVWEWLQSVDYPEEDCYDGGSEKAWRVYNEQYGIVSGDWSAFVAIHPTWIYHPR